MCNDELINIACPDLLATAFFTLEAASIFRQLFEDDQPVWSGLDRLETVIKNYFKTSDAEDSLIPAGIAQFQWENREGCLETILSVEKGYYADRDRVFRKEGLAIGSGSFIEPGVVVKPPLIIGRNTEIRQGAYIRGGAIVGNHCTVGHTTEVKTAVFMDHTEAGHFAYIGDSILGAYVNLGAGTKLANLPFRSRSLKVKQAFDLMKLRINDRKIPLNRSKLGAILGDGVETGCNSTLAPGTLAGPDSWIYPCVFVRGGYYPSGSMIKSSATNQIEVKKLKM